VTAFAVQLRKEARALLPWWLGMALVTTACSLLARRNAEFPHFRNDEESLVVVVYTLGMMAVASLSIGHELTHGTLQPLLVQPVTRLRILLTKLLVLCAFVLALGLSAEWWLINRYIPAGSTARTLLVWGPVLAAIGLVPLLTMLTRKPLGGFVFAVALPALVFLTAERLYSVRDAWSIGWYGTLAMSVAGVTLLLYRFPRLEAAGEGAGLALPIGPRVAVTDVALQQSLVTRRRRWSWLLVKKELRLQYLTFSVAGVYVLAGTFVALAQGENRAYMGPTFFGVSVMHGCFIALLAGCVASAEERHLGVLASNVLLPHPGWRQWWTKVGVTMAIVAALGIGLPALLGLILRPLDPFVIVLEYVLGIALLTCGALYVSSLSANTLRALLAALPALALAMAIGGAILDWLVPSLSDWLGESAERLRVMNRRAPQAVPPAVRFEFWASTWAVGRISLVAMQVLAAGLGIVTLILAARNHRSLDRGHRTVMRQVGVLLLYVVVAAVVYVTIRKIGWASIR
jgi:hypothetical protein